MSYIQFQDKNVESDTKEEQYNIYLIKPYINTLFIMNKII